MDTTAATLTSSHSRRLMELDEPDAAYLLAAEAEQTKRPRRRALVVLVSDRDPGDADNTSKVMTELLAEFDFDVDGVVHVRSKKSQIRKAIETAVVGGVDLVLTVGGVGVGPRDKTPEATEDILDQQVEGIAQALRASGQYCGAVDATISRGIAGISGSTVVVNLAPSRAAIRDGMATLPPMVHHLIDQLQEYDVER